MVNTISEAKTVDELSMNRQHFISYTAFSYHLFPQLGSTEYDAKGKFLTDSLPAPIIKYHDDLNGKADPVMDFILSKGAPFWLTELLDNKEFSDGNSSHLVDAAIKLMGEGLIIPVYGPFHKRGCYVFSFRKKRNFFDEVFKWQLQALAQIQHVKYCIITNSLQMSIKLTKRESEVLELITFGKTNPEIGKILNISTSTVSGYVKQIYLKLGVSDRVSAALRARNFSYQN